MQFVKREYKQYLRDELVSTWKFYGEGTELTKRHYLYVTTPVSTKTSIEAKGS